MRRVIVESPFKGKDEEEEKRNIAYARLCLHDCFMRGEAPFASHLLYTQPTVLNDKIPEERRLGIEAGLEWGRAGGEASAVYTDLGITEGMQKGIKRAESEKRPVEYRRLYPPI